MIYTKRRQVFFLSMDKFMLPYDTLVDPVSELIDSDYFKGAYVFIDEFDATKETILNRIINDKSNHINLISLSKQIVKGLKFTDCPTIYAGKLDVIEKSKNNFNQLSDEFCLQYAFKTSEEIKEADKFLFHDNGYWGQTTEKNLIVETDTKRKQNLIKEDTACNKTHTLYEILSKIQSKLTYFQNGVSYIAKDYVITKNVELKTAVDSFLNLFLDYPYNDYISSQVMSMLRAEQKNKRSEISIMDKFDISFYKRGFRYTRLSNNEFSNAEQSDVILYTYNETPEAVMEKMAKVAKVVGISATATLKTVLGNYDIDYLQRKLLDKYHYLSSEEKKQLDDFLYKTKEHYDRVNIHIELTPFFEKDYSDEIWHSIVQKKDVADEIAELLNNKYSKDKYLKCRFFRIAWAFSQFFSHKDIKSFLCFMNLHPKDGNDLDRSTLTFIFDRIMDRPNQSQEMVRYLNKEDYDKNLGNIKNELSSGKKLFVISVYKTLGTGQNPQYKLPKDEDPVQINNLYESSDKDFDAVYLDKPTNIISNLYDSNKQMWNDEEFMKFVFEIKYLCQNGNISDLQKKDLINSGARKMIGDRFIKPKDKISFENMQPYKGLATQILNQACGRICRTNNKNKNIYIFADRDIANVIDPTTPEQIPLSPEFEKLLEELKKVGIQPAEPTKFEEKAKKVSTDTSRTIGNYLNWDGEWTPNKKSDWKDMRLFSLKHPTLTNEEYKSFPLCDMYVELPQKQGVYWYCQSEDYGKFDNISFNKRLSQEVSEEECQLRFLMKIPNITAFFTQQKFATSWKIGEYIMSPSLYSRIYKGALGEVIGKHIFYNLLGIDLEEISDNSVYEFFDYKFRNRSIYVDFKKWKEIDLGVEESSKIRSKIFSKAKKCNAKMVLIVNILSEFERKCKQPQAQDNCTLLEIPQLYVVEGENVRLSSDSISFILQQIESHENKYQPNKLQFR